jgi:hypothetical protein
MGTAGGGDQIADRPIDGLIHVAQRDRSSTLDAADGLRRCQSWCPAQCFEKTARKIPRRRLQQVADNRRRASTAANRSWRSRAYSLRLGPDQVTGGTACAVPTLAATSAGSAAATAS